MAGILNTQNKAWADDKSKFGYRMLQKMGWSEGKGLGVKEDGGTEHLRARKKTSNAGIGSTSAAREAWKVPAQVANDLNDVLSRLSAASVVGVHKPLGAGKAIAPAGEGARSKATRGFFGRRVAGKAVAGYSQDALREIFGGAPTAPTPASRAVHDCGQPLSLAKDESEGESIVQDGTPTSGSPVQASSSPGGEPGVKPEECQENETRKNRKLSRRSNDKDCAVEKSLKRDKRRRKRDVCSGRSEESRKQRRRERKARKEAEALKGTLGVSAHRRKIRKPSSSKSRKDK